MTLGSFVRQYREEHSLSMGEFAKLAGISKTYVSMLEADRRPNGKLIAPSVTTLEKISKATLTSMDDLLRLLGNDQSIDLQEIIDKAYIHDTETMEIIKEIQKNPKLYRIVTESKSLDDDQLDEVFSFIEFKKNRAERHGD